MSNPVYQVSPIEYVVKRNAIDFNKRAYSRLYLYPPFNEEGKTSFIVYQDITNVLENNIFVVSLGVKLEDIPEYKGDKAPVLDVKFIDKGAYKLSGDHHIIYAYRARTFGVQETVFVRWVKPEELEQLAADNKETE